MENEEGGNVSKYHSAIGRPEAEGSCGHDSKCSSTNIFVICCGYFQLLAMLTYRGSRVMGHQSYLLLTHINASSNYRSL